MNPLCFILMPFGRKPDGTGRIVDYDLVYAQVIAPAVRSAGLDVIRADEEQVGGTIHRPMFERLLLCEYAVADLTGANPNVYYELGIRHAAKPRSTILLFAEGTVLPFDVAPLRGLPYQLDAAGHPRTPESCSKLLSSRLKAMRTDSSDDSPLFQLIGDMPRFEVDLTKFDLFRSRAEIARAFKEQLATARSRGKAEVLDLASDPSLADLAEVEAGLVVALFLSLRDVEAFDEMLSLYERMSRPLQRTRVVQEQRAFALNRLSRRDEAERVLQSVLADHGPSGETYGLLGRVYKDRRRDALAAGDRFQARGAHRKAIDAYVAGFELDWRDPYPGVNALTLMELGEPGDPRQAEIAPVVLFAATRRARSGSAGYWEQATLCEVAVLAREREMAENALADALAILRVAWMAGTTHDNLRLIRETRAARGETLDWVLDLETELLGAKVRLARQFGATGPTAPPGLA